MKAPLTLGATLVVAGLFGTMQTVPAAQAPAHVATKATGTASRPGHLIVQPAVKLTRAQHTARKHQVASASCTVITPSSDMQQYMYGSGPYTAAVVVTASGTVSGMNVNASGCDFGIYVAPGVSGATISGNLVHDAFEVGIGVDEGATANVDGNQVSQTGWHDSNGYDPNGVQVGLGIFYLGASGDIGNNFITQYQKNGITVNYSGNYVPNISMENNNVSGMGSSSDPTTFIAQNGVQIVGANFSAQPTGNFSALNWYQATSYGYVATGYLLCGDTLDYKRLTKKEFVNNSGGAGYKNSGYQDQYPVYFSPSITCY